MSKKLTLRDKIREYLKNGPKRPCEIQRDLKMIKSSMSRVIRQMKFSGEVKRIGTKKTGIKYMLAGYIPIEKAIEDVLKEKRKEGLKEYKIIPYTDIIESEELKKKVALMCGLNPNNNDFLDKYYEHLKKTLDKIKEVEDEYTLSIYRTINNINNITNNWKYKEISIRLMKLINIEDFPGERIKTPSEVHIKILKNLKEIEAELEAKSKTPSSS